MKIGITGGTGFIGSYLVRELYKNGYNDYVVATSRKVKNEDNHLVYSDYSEESFLDIFSDCDIIIHAGSRVQESTGLGSILDYVDNIKTTENLLKAINTLGIKRLIATSSCTVYNEENSPFTEEMGVWPNNNYGISKAIMEMQIEAFQKNSDLKAVIFRISQVLGYREYKGKGFYQMLLDNCINKRPVVLYEGNDNASRDYIYVKDVCSAILLALETDIRGIYNLGMGCPTSNIQLAETYVKCFENTDSGIVYLPNIGNRDTRYWYMNIEKIHKELNWRPAYTLQEMVTDIRQEYKNSIEHK